MKKLLGFVAAAALMFSVATPAKAALEDYRIMPGTQFDMVLGTTFSSVQAAFTVGTVVQVEVDTAGNVLSIKVPGTVVALKDFTTNIALPAATPVIALVNMWNDPGTWDVGNITMAKAEGFFTSNVNNAPQSGPVTWQQKHTTQPAVYMYNNLGGFLAVQGGFGGPLGLRGGAFAVGLDVKMDVFGQNYTTWTGAGPWSQAQALPWVTGVASVRQGYTTTNMTRTGTFFYKYSYVNSSYPSGYPFPSHASLPVANGLRTGASKTTGSAAVFNASGAATAMGVNTYVINAFPYNSSMAVNFTTVTGTKNLGPETVTVSLVMPSIFNPGVPLGILGSIQMNLQRIVPEPGTALLLGLGVIGLAAVGRKRQN